MLLACFNEEIEDVIKTKINNEEPYTHEELERSKKRFGKIFEIGIKNTKTPETRGGINFHNFYLKRRSN